MLRHIAAIALLLVVEAAAFIRLLVVDPDGVPHRLIPWDFRSLGAPWLIYGWDAIRAGFAPLWCPYVAAGAPYFLNPQSQVYSPLAIVIGTVFGYSVRGVQIHSVLMMMIGGIGAYGLAYQMWRHRVGALFAGLAFELSALLFCHLEHISILSAFALIPWFFLALAMAQEARSRWGLPLLAFVIYWLLTSGYPGVNIMVMAWGGALVVAQVVAQTTASTRKALLLRHAWAWLVGIGMAAVNWLPFLLHRSDVTRGSGISVDAALDPSGSLAPRHLLDLFISFLITHPLPGKSTDLSMRGLYCGVVAIVLAVVFAVNARGWRVLLLAGSAVFAFLMACGGNFFVRVALHTVLPVFNYSRFPAADSRAFVVLALVVMAGGGLALLARDHEPTRELTRRILRYLIVFYLVGIPVMRWLYDKIDDAVLSGLVFQILCLLLALFAVVRFRGQVLAWVLTTIVVLETGYSVVVNFYPAGWAISKADYLSLANSHQPRFTTAGTADPRLGDPARVNDQSSSDGYIAKHFYSNEYNPIHLLGALHLIEAGFGPWLKAGERVMGLPPGKFPEKFAEFEAAAFPVKFTIADFWPNRVRYKVTTKADTNLVFNEVYLSGWKAIVDGVAKPVLPLAQGLRSVLVTAGSHEITLYFRPWTYWVGAAISLLFGLSFLAWVFVLWRKKASLPPIPGPAPFWTESA
jgi:hypothetical protein